MVLVDGLGVVDAAEEAGDVVLRDADQGLQDEDDVGDQADDAVGGVEMWGAVGEFVIFDDDQAGDEGEGAGAVEDGVDVSAEFFLLGSVCRL